MLSRIAAFAAVVLAAAVLPPSPRAHAGGDPAAPPRAGPLMEGMSAGEGTPLSRHWELDEKAKQGTFLFRPHRPVYFLPLRFGGDPDNEPSSPTRGAAPAQGLDQVETKFQLSFKIKAAQSLLGIGADLWIGYTQQSQWQVYNGAISRPFRETNHEPEVMLVIPARFDLLLRPWYRLPEDREEDDNPDLEDYLGHGDALAIYQWRRRTLSVLLRDNLQTDRNRGTVQVEHSFPIHGRLEGFVQTFWGYGETLIDYNHREAVAALGILLIDWM